MARKKTSTAPSKSCTSTDPEDPPVASADPVAAEVPEANAPPSPQKMAESQPHYGAIKKKRTRNAFMIYSAQERPKYQGTGTKVTEVAKQIGASWQSLADEEKNRFKAMAEQEKQAALVRELAAAQG